MTCTGIFLPPKSIFLFAVLMMTQRFLEITALASRCHQRASLCSPCILKIMTKSMTKSMTRLKYGVQTCVGSGLRTVLSENRRILRHSLLRSGLGYEILNWKCTFLTGSRFCCLSELQLLTAGLADFTQCCCACLVSACLAVPCRALPGSLLLVQACICKPAA